ncbi:MAG: SulP family inorganic anion transporter [Crocinitomicaceae bacterium]|nr:SulP family inorganic anion transporter [Crocinitomicaceae bacterium]MBP6033050.1 SulP family inorganic anion transporter [Crocinitomicaceae bacterium]
MSVLNKFLGKDFLAGLVVFLVALPLCLGIGLASTNVEDIPSLPSVFPGLLAGVIGGIVVGLISGSRVGVSGPAAGLITIIISSIGILGSYEAFLVSVILAGVIQLIFGFFKLGIIAKYVPTSVIKGMLAAIGITLILKEIPHLLGYDKDFFGDESFWQFDGHNTFTELVYSMNAFQEGSVLIGLLSILIIIVLDKPFFKKNSVMKLIPSALIVVLVGVMIQLLTKGSFLEVSSKHLVQLPVLKSFSEISTVLFFPDFNALGNWQVYTVAITIALVASLETLLSVEATDKLDPEKNTTPTSRELSAQGIGNIFSGFIGGLPITQVVVRSSANIDAGGKTKLAAVIHGVLLILAVILLPVLLNQIPLASLAAILIMVGYKLTKAGLFKEMYMKGMDQFIPFILTIVGVLFTDLLKGIGIGLVVSIYFILRRNSQNHFTKTETDGELHIRLSEEVTFLNKVGIHTTLENAAPHSKIIIDASNCKSIDQDILELLEEFKKYGSVHKEIDFQLINFQHLR